MLKIFHPITGKTRIHHMRNGQEMYRNRYRHLHRLRNPLICDCALNAVTGVYNDHQSSKKQIATNNVLNLLFCIK